MDNLYNVLLSIFVCLSYVCSTNVSFSHHRDECFQQYPVNQCNCSCEGQCEQKPICCDTERITSNFSGNFTANFHSYFTCFPHIYSSHLIVTRCPDEWTDGTTRHLCEGTTFLTPREVIPVTVEYLGFEITFRNKYCAICHSQLTFSYSTYYFTLDRCPAGLLLTPTQKDLLEDDILPLVNLCEKYIPDSTNNIANLCSCQHPLDAYASNKVFAQWTYDNEVNIKPIFTPNCSSNSAVYGPNEECELGFRRVNGTCRQILAVNRCLDVYSFVSSFDKFADGYLQSVNMMQTSINVAFFKLFQKIERSGLHYLWIATYRHRRYEGIYKENGDNCTLIYTDVIVARPDENEMVQLREAFDSWACNFKFVSDNEQISSNELCKIDSIPVYTSEIVFSESSIMCYSDLDNSWKDNEIRLFHDYAGCDSRLDTSHAIILKCPDDWREERIRQMCENTEQNTLDEMVPVIAPVNITGLHVTFRNQYCAICHGQRDYQSVPVVVNASTCSIENGLRKFLRTNMTIVESIESFLQEKQCVLYLFSGYTDVLSSCPCQTTDKKFLLEIFLNESQSPTSNLKCPPIKENGMPKWKDCGVGYMEIGGECRRLYLPNVCLINYRFVYPLITVDGMDEDLISTIMTKFYQSMTYPDLVYDISEYVIVPGLTKDKKQCIEIYIDVLFLQPFNDYQQSVIDGITQFPCPVVGNCTVTFLPIGNLLLDRFCNPGTDNMSVSMSSTHDLLRKSIYILVTAYSCIVSKLFLDIL